MASFVVIYYGNTGSSWLIQTLGSAPGVMIPAFEPVEGWAWEASDEEKLDWIRTAFSPPVEREGPGFEKWVERLAESPQFTELPTKDFDTVGFKMNGRAIEDQAGLIRLFAELGTKTIFLQRDNRIKHALSLYRYHEEQKSQFELAGVRPPSKIKLKAFDRWAEDSTRLHENHLAFRGMAGSVLDADDITDVSYEEFVTPGGKAAVIDRLAGFLGLNREEVSHGEFEKATPDSLRDAVVNYERLRRHFRRTPLARHFDDE